MVSTFDFLFNMATLRWIQRFNNYRNALLRLEEVVEHLNAILPVDNITLRIYEDSIIQRFEYTQEMAWKVMKDYLLYQGENDIIASRSAIRKALKAGLISDPAWMNTIEDRNLSSHKYDEEVALGIGQRVRDTYLNLFKDFEKEMLTRMNDDMP